MTRLSHHAKSKVGRRRSQLKLKRRAVLVCPSCKGPTFGHRACPQCGTYVRQKSEARNSKP